MLLRMAVVDGIVEGRFDRVYRRWSAPRAKAGGRQRTPKGELRVEAITRVTMASLTADDARRSGHATLVALKKELGKRTGHVYRIDLTFAGEDPRVALRNRSDLSEEELATLTAKLARKDRGSEPWTKRYLRAIADQPGTRAVDIATELGLDKPTFKRRVRQLKELGLTESLKIGYRLSPRGVTLLKHLALLIVLLPLAGCPSAPEPTEPTPAEDLGFDPVTPAGPGEARAGIVRSGAGETALFGGVNAEGAPGDIKLYNSRVQLVIQAAKRSHGMVDTGGHIIDAELVRGDGTLGRDTLEDLYLAFGLARLFHADTVEVVSDGTDGGDAVVRSVGTDVPWQYMTGLFELPEPTIDDLTLRIEQEVRLPPDSVSVTLTTTLTNEGSAPVTFAPRDGLMSSGEDLWTWAPGKGLLGPEAGEVSAVGVTGHRGESTLAVWPDDGTFSTAGLGALAGDLGIRTLTHPEVTLAAGDTHTLVRHFAVGSDIATTEEARWSQQGEDLAEVTGTVTSGGAAVAGVRVWFVDGEEVAGFAMSEGDGSYRAALPPGDWTVYAVARAYPESVQLADRSMRLGPMSAASVQQRHLDVLQGAAAPPLPFAEGRATPVAESLSLPAEGATLDLAMPGASGARFEVTSDGAAIPAVLDVRWVGGSPEGNVPAGLHDALGIESGGRALWGWTANGTLDAPLIPGTYTVRAGHGQRHTQSAATEFVVEEGQTETVPLTLTEEVERDGWLALDAHLHAAPSFDGTLGMAHRLVTCAATGVDIPVMTDHDRQVDYTPLASALGLDELFTVVPGIEVTTVVRGHFNLYPITPEPSEPNGGAEPWWINPGNTQELFDRMRDRAGPETLTQVNHPRTPGMFSVSQFDPEDGEPRNNSMWSWDFELFELLNGGVIDLPQVRADWFGMLNNGRVRVPMGSSDSHYSYIPCGWGRTDVFLDTTSPADVSIEAVREALLAGHVVVAGGTTLRATLDMGEGAVMPGDTTSGAAGNFRVTVQAPEWIQPGTLRVYRNGEVIHEEALETPNGATWFDGTIPVSADGDSWFAVEVEGSEPVAELWRGFTPYAITNAFFVGE
ncbi:MAG: CehA/McbA family metallohydrolase [Deltaproteobacteria bacterium]|nr:CehA/McbA family metallohydrolase [Deltaproteobacteria bacterium]